MTLDIAKLTDRATRVKDRSELGALTNPEFAMESDRPLSKPRFRFTLRQLLIATAAIGLLFGVWAWFIHKELTVRPATPADAVAKNYFGFESDDLAPRNIAVVSGTFTKSTWLSASLSVVQSGSIQEINGFTVGRSPNQIGSPPWQTLTIRLALGEKDTPIGRITNSGSAGHSRGEGSSGSFPHHVQTVASQVFPGRLTPKRERIIYVEGDRQPVVTDDMPLAEFASKNGGNYLVVVGELE